MAKIVEYRGVVYRRYEGRLYYNPGGSAVLRGATSLHRQVWLDAGNDIPAGWHVHHRDGDHDNNDISNLECLPGDEHSRMHARERLAGELGQRLKEWRGSDDGQAILRDNARKMRARTPERECACRHCGGAFRTRHPRQVFCSDPCNEQFNFPLELACEICGTGFRAKRNAKRQVRTCSYSCGWSLRRKNAGLQSDG